MKKILLIIFLGFALASNAQKKPYDSLIANSIGKLIDQNQKFETQIDSLEEELKTVRMSFVAANYIVKYITYFFNDKGEIIDSVGLKKAIIKYKDASRKSP